MEMKFIEDKDIKVSEGLYLKKVTKKDTELLYVLMNRIYRPAYKSYWKDNGEWYVNELYNKQNIYKELEETAAGYLFVVFKEEVIGIIRTVKGIDTEYSLDARSIKLHRLYLDQKTQNQGVGKQIMNWFINDSSKKGYKKLWLEVMVQQHQAIHFYKTLGFTEVDKVIIDFPLLFDEYRGMYKMVKNL